MKEEIIEAESKLLEYLLNKFDKLSRNSVKNLLINKQVVINGKVVTKYDYVLKKGDKISFSGKKDKMGLKIIYEDDVFLVIDKPYNLLTVATDKEKEKTAYVEVSKYIKQSDPKSKVYVLHRLDQDTSGVLVFCKSENVKNELQDCWNDLVIQREYVAVVEGVLNKKEGILKSYLKEGKNRMVYSTKERDGKLAITEYKVVKENNKYSLVCINLHTGRKNQIRVHFKDLKHPLIGDKKYGSIEDPLKRLCLHASKIKFKYKDKEYCFESSAPFNFENLVK
jgi:23S rRNA pseudouridine1911/1915/1917 synthase